MPIIPSKKKVQPSNSCIQTLTSFIEDSNHPYPMLVQIFKQGNNHSPYQTPIKPNKPNSYRTTITWTCSTKAQSQQKLTSLFNRLLMMRNKIQLRRQKVQVLTQHIIKVTQYRIQINNYTVELLKSIKQISQIKQLCQRQNTELEQIKQLIETTRRQKERIQKQLHKITQNVKILQDKIKQKSQNYKHMQQRSANISYAVESQIKKNKNIMNKLLQLQNQYTNPVFLLKLSRQLFIILVLFSQIRNISILNKQNMNSHRKVKHKNDDVYANIKLCHKNINTLNKIPFDLVILGQIYMYEKMKMIDRKYLNKISYFCNQIQGIFDYAGFCQMLKQYFICKWQQLTHRIQQQQTCPSQFYSQIKKQREQKQLNAGKVRKQLNIFVSINCECGPKISKIMNQRIFHHLLEQIFELNIGQIEQTEGCSYIELPNNQNQKKIYKQQFGNHLSKQVYSQYLNSQLKQLQETNN